MTQVQIDLVDVLGHAPTKGDLVWIRAAKTRSSAAGAVVVPAAVPIEVHDGPTVELEPGPARVRFELKYLVADQGREFPITVPDEGPVTLRDLLEESYQWDPLELSAFAQLRAAATDAAGTATDAAGTATTAAQQTGQDRQAVAQDRTAVEDTRALLDEAYDQSQAGMALPPRLMESELKRTYANRQVAGRQPPRPLAAATFAAGSVTPIDYFDGALWGVNGSTIHRSTDEGATWPVYATAPSGVGVVRRVLPTADGGAVVVGATGVVKASSWATTPVFSALKVTVNGAARISQFQADGNGTKFIVAEYGPGEPSRIDSRYAHISTDMGETWTRAYDSVALQGAAADISHVHGCCYDPWEDVFYVAEGHTVGSAGLWLSQDDGATWQLYDGHKVTSAPTVLVATDDGLVLGSDDARAGMMGIPRVGPIEDRQVIHTWAWRAGNDGVLGFGMQGARDPETGVVYIAFRTAIPGLPPIIAAGSATAANVVYTHPVGAAAVNGDVFSSIALLPSGKVLARADVGGSSQTLSAWRTSLGPDTQDRGGVGGGSAPKNTSVAVGAGTSTGEHSWAVLVGQSATLSGGLSTALGAKASAGLSGTAVGESAAATTSGVAVGRAAIASADNAVAVGPGAAATGSEAVTVGRNSTGGTNAVVIGGSASANANTVAVGRASSTTGGAAVAVGASAVAATSGTVLGASAIAATSATAIGRAANASGDNSVALGRDTVADSAFQVAVGPRDIEVQDAAKGLVLKSPNGTRYRVTVADGGTLAVTTA